MSVCMVAARQVYHGSSFINVTRATPTKQASIHGAAREEVPLGFDAIGRKPPHPIVHIKAGPAYYQLKAYLIPTLQYSY